MNKLHREHENAKAVQQIIVISTIDAVVSSVPGLNIAWNIVKAANGYALQRRLERASEFIENIQNNPEHFAKDILETEAFQDCFVIAMGRYILERNNLKRGYMRAIFNHGTQHKYDSSFELEKMFNAINILNGDDIKVLKEINMNTQQPDAIAKNGLDPVNENISNLASVGILIIDTSARLGGDGTLYFKPTQFGKKFVEYIESNTT